MKVRRVVTGSARSARYSSAGGIVSPTVTSVPALPRRIRPRGRVRRQPRRRSALRKIGSEGRRGAARQRHVEGEEDGGDGLVVAGEHDQLDETRDADLLLRFLL